MSSPASTGLPPVTPPLVPDAPALDRLLLDLRRRSWGDPTTNALTIMRAAAEALGAETVVVWLPGESGGMEPFLHHPLGAAGCERRSFADVAGDRPLVEELIGGPADTFVRAEGPWTVVDAGVWAQGQLACVLVTKRSAGRPWTSTERGFLARVADRLATEAVAETKRIAEQMLGEREQQMDLIERMAGLGSWEIDLRTDAIRWSREQMRIHGVDTSGRPGTHRDFMTMVHPDDRQVVTEGMSRLTAHTPVSVEFRIVRPDGEVRLLQAQGLLAVAQDGQLTRVIGTSLDITERRATELALRASEESYRSIFDSSNDAIFVQDLETGAVLDANRRACAVNDVTLDELRASGLSLIANAAAPFTPAQALAYMRRAAAGDEVRFEWMTSHRTTREAMWVEVSLQRVTIRGEVRLLALVRDIRDRKRSELALRASEESYRTIFENASDAMWVHDIDTGVFLDVNNAAVEQYGYSVEEQQTIGVAGLSDGRPPFTPERGMQYVRRAAAGEPQRFEWLGRHKDGHPVWAEVRLRRVTIGGVDRILATARDINDRKAAEDALCEANEALERRVAERTAELAASNAALAEEVWEHARAKAALQQREAQLHETQRIARVGSWQLELATGALLGDATMHALYGLDAETAPRDFAGWYDRVHPDDREAARDTLERAVTAGGPFIVDHRIILPDGGVRYLHGRGTIVADEHGEPMRVVGSAQDVTERAAAEHALQVREEHFRRLIENTSDFVMIVDPTAAITYVGPSVTRLLGYEPHEVLGTRPADLVHPDDVEHVMREFAEIVANPGQTTTSTFRIRHKDGSYRVLENIGRTIALDTAAEGVVANGRDVTERKKDEQVLARAKEEAERANRAKSEFLSRMSHELRTPMNSILGFAQLLARADLAPQQGKSVGHILKAGRHLLTLINEVLEIARIESGRENFSLEPVALGSVMQEAFGLVRPLAQQWEVELREGTWPREAFVQADRQRLVQVLLNLLSNAIKYNRRGGYVRLAACASEGGWTVRVEDSGHGIPGEKTGQLFTPFARLGAEQTEVEGTGLGLALSRRLCEAMGGDLVLERTGAEGSVFRLTLHGAADPLGTLEETGTFAIPAGPHRAATLLYVEDNLANLSLVDTILLSRPGWRTLPALQGQLGVELAREHTPDVILLDLHLPDIPGLEVLRRLRSDPRTRRIPIVVVSADATPSSLDRLRAAGADAYLTKPLDVDEFLRVVDSFLPALEGPTA